MYKECVETQSDNLNYLSMNETLCNSIKMELTQ